MVNYSQWHTERSTSKKVHAIEEINVLCGKMDEVMKLFASKSAPIDPNDMPLSTLIENNNEPMDVNFVGRNNFGNNAYRGNFNQRKERTGRMRAGKKKAWVKRRSPCPFIRAEETVRLLTCLVNSLIPQAP